MKSRTTGSATSASNRATRISRIAAPTSSSLSAPRPRSRSKMSPRRLLRVSNMLAFLSLATQTQNGPARETRGPAAFRNWKVDSRALWQHRWTLVFAPTTVNCEHVGRGIRCLYRMQFYPFKMADYPGIVGTMFGTTSLERRRELGDFIRAQRERVAPASVGLVAARRRRTPGLRREEVAELSGLSTTWYTWIEQGRDVSVSPTALARLAGALRLDRAQRTYLFELAG